MKRTIICAALAGLLAMSGQAFAVIGAIDVVPAATILIPKFVVEVGDACTTNRGLTTLFAVGNASAAPTVAHVTLWTDLSIPSLDFDIYLTGFDIQTVNLRDVFCRADLPQTGVTVVPSGPKSLANATLSCPNSQFAGAPNFNFLNHLVAWHTGNQSPVTGDCAGSGQTGDDVVIGYITIDNASVCSQLFPSDAGYFGDGGTGTANNNNVLFSDYFYVDDVNDFAQGFSSVHIEARGSVANGFWNPAIDHTYYGRYVATSAIDNREPLPTVWGTRYALGGAFDGTHLGVWREADDNDAAFNCNDTTPGVFPLTLIQDGQNSPNQPPFPVLNKTNGNLSNGSMCFDENENVVLLVPGPSGDPGVLPPYNINYETTWVTVGGPQIPTPFNFGWVMLNLRHTAIEYAHTPHGGAADDLAQAWVTTVFQAAGRFSAGWDGVQLDNIFLTPLGSHAVVGGN